VTSPDSTYVSRAGHKLAGALDAFHIDPTGWTCADLGCSTGGFVDCLRRRGALRVYAVDRGYGVIDYRLRNDPRVVVMERVDALHVHLPEPVDLVTLDTGWTRQRHILPVARRLLRFSGTIVALIKPHYEADPSQLVDGVLPDDNIAPVLKPLKGELGQWELTLLNETPSPIRGRGGNQEYLWHLAPATPRPSAP